MREFELILVSALTIITVVVAAYNPANAVLARTCELLTGAFLVLLKGNKGR